MQLSNLCTTVLGLVTCSMPSDGDTTVVYLCHFNVYSLWDLPLQQDSACATEQLHAEHSLSIGCHCMPWAILWSLCAVNTMQEREVFYILCPASSLMDVPGYVNPDKLMNVPIGFVCR